MPTVQHPFRTEAGYYAERAAGLLTSARDGTQGAVEAFAGLGAPLTVEGARHVVAVRHGEASWVDLVKRAARLPTSGEPFAAAFRALEAHDLAALRTLLDAHPDLVVAVGTNGNDLLGLASPSLAATRLLLERGADPGRGNVHGWTALHQAAYGDHARLARTLLDAGAPVGAEARGTGGTPLVVALFWGHRRVADVLLEAGGPLPGNLRVAAGTGDAAGVATLSSDADAGRGFYRPHGGFPNWRPSADRQEVLDEALAWAARSDRAAVLEPLMGEGARVDADVYRGSALAWAAWTGAENALGELLRLGAAVDGPSSFGGGEHGEGATPLMLAAQAGREAAVDALLAAGASRSARDALHGGIPADWAGVGGHARLARRLRTG